MGSFVDELVEGVIVVVVGVVVVVVEVVVVLAGLETWPSGPRETTSNTVVL